MILVCERDGRWALALTRALADWGRPPRQTKLVETRSIDECRARLHEHPAALLVVEFLPATAEAAMRLLDDLPRLAPQARAVVVADRSWADVEWWVRDFGAVYFHTSPRNARPLAELALRHAEQTAPRHASPADRVWNELPWNAC